MQSKNSPASILTPIGCVLARGAGPRGLSSYVKRSPWAVARCCLVSSLWSLSSLAPQCAHRHR